MVGEDVGITVGAMQRVGVIVDKVTVGASETVGCEVGLAVIISTVTSLVPLHVREP